MADHNGAKVGAVAKQRYMRICFSQISHTLASAFLTISVAVTASTAHAELPSGHTVINGAADIGNTSNTDLLIRQQTDRLTLQWQKFNIGKNNSVTFEQPSASSIAINRIQQNDPSRILGALNANGQVYLINQNGFLFGPNSRINVNSLVVSALDITQEAIDQGIAAAVNNNNSAAFVGDGRVFIRDGNGNDVLFAKTINGDYLRYAVDENGDFVLDQDTGQLIPDEFGKLITFTEAQARGIVTADIEAKPHPVQVKLTHQFGRDDAGNVIVERATVKTATAGKILVFAPPLIDQNGDFITDDNGQVIPSILNEGRLETNDGQIILAAGQKIYLTQNQAGAAPGLKPATDDEYVSELKFELQGFLVEVDVGGTVVNGNTLANSAVTNKNDLIGQIIAQRGNVTLMGLAVNQNGLVSATTAVQQNGSIRLLARDTVSIDTDDPIPFRPTRTGNVTLGENAVTEVLPEVRADSAAPDSVEQSVSAIEVVGDVIEFKANSKTVASGGDIIVSALTDPNPNNIPPGDFRESAAPGHARIYVEAGAVLDVSGTVADKSVSFDTKSQESVLVDKSVTDNLITVDLRADELKDRPLQREGILRGADVTVDIRQSGRLDDGSEWQGTPVADISGSIGLRVRTAEERLSNGGRIILQAENDVIINPGATLDLSGGAHVYKGGLLNTTQLLTADGRLLDISQADPNLIYRDVIDPFNGSPSQRLLPGYIEGKDAGELFIDARDVILAGNIIGNTQTGIYQRKKPTTLTADQLYRAYDQVPLGGRIQIGRAFGGTGNNGIDRIKNVTFAKLPDTVKIPGVNQTLDASYDGTVYLDPKIFSLSGGVNRIQIAPSPMGRVTFPEQNAPHTFLPGTSLAIQQGVTVIDDDLYLPSGSFTAGATIIKDDVELSVAGTWVNNNFLLTNGAPQGAEFIDGGDITISGILTLGDNVTFNLNGGALREANGRINGGDAGSITFGRLARNNPGAIDVNFEAFGAATGKGGSFTFNQQGTGGISVSTTNGNGLLELEDLVTGDLKIDPEFFSKYGFAKFDIDAGQSFIIGEAGVPSDSKTVIAPEVLFRDLSVFSANNRTGSDIRNFSSIASRPLHERQAITLTLEGGSLFQLHQNHELLLPVQSTLTASASGRLIIDGLIQSLAGNIALRETTASDIQRNNQLLRNGVFLTSNAGLDVSAAIRVIPNSIGVFTGEVLDAGNINIAVERGYFIMQDNAFIDVSGKAQAFFVNNGGLLQQQIVAADAGSIILGQGTDAINEGIIIDRQARLIAHAAEGINTARGGSITVTLGEDGAVRDPLGVIPRQGYQVIIQEQDVSILPDNFMPGDLLPDSVNGKAVLSQNLLQNSGADNLSITVFDQNVSIPNVSQNDPTRVRRGNIHLAGDYALNLRGSLALNAPFISSDGGDIAINANTVSIGRLDQNDELDVIIRRAATAGFANAIETTQDLYPLQPIVNGPGKLSFNSNFTQLQGHSVFSGFDTVSLNSTTDIRLRGQQTTANRSIIRGSLYSAANLEFNSSQLYPVTLNEFYITAAATIDVEPNAIGDPSDDVQTLIFNPSIRISRANDNELPVLSAGGRVFFEANTIEQAGVVKAPFGEISFIGKPIELNKNNLNVADTTIDATLLFTDNSLSSTSAEGLLIPFGETQVDTDWVYALTGRTLIFGDAEGQIPLPQKSINLLQGDTEDGDLAALAIDVQNGALFDISGDSGDLLAYNFEGGVRGTQDILSASEAPNSFAIIPGLNPLFAPYDAVFSQNSTLRPGDAVFLESSAFGIEAGTYTLLPARYALLPGAFLISELDLRNIDPSTSLLNPDGSALVAGRRTIQGSQSFAGLNTPIIDSSNRAYRILAGSDLIVPAVTADAEQNVPIFARYTVNQATPFFNQRVLESGEALSFRLPVDSGRLSIYATKSLNLNGSLRRTNFNGVNASGRGSQVDIAAGQIAIVANRNSNRSDGFLQLDVSQLAGLNAESIFLGGLRSGSGNSTDLDIVASDIAVETGVDLSLPELLLAASDNLNIDATAVLSASSNSGRRAADTILNLSDNAALLRLSSINQARLRRSADSFSGVAANLDIAAGATLGADRAALLTAQGDFSISGVNFNLSQASLTLDALQFNLGEVPMTVTTGVTLTAQDIAGLDVSALVLDSRNAIDLYGNGVFNTNNLTLRTPGLNAMLAATDYRFIASDTIRLENPDANSNSRTAAGNGSLSFTAKRVALGDTGPNDFAFNGFTDVDINANDELLLASDGKVTATGNIHVTTARLTAENGVDYSIHSQANLIFDTGNSNTVADRVTTLGARLDLTSGGDINIDTLLELPSGIINVKADGDILVGNNATLDVAGSVFDFAGELRGTSGGSVVFESASGIVDLTGGSIDISASQAGGEAGSITIRTVNYAGGRSINFDTQLFADAQSGFRSGTFILDTFALNDILSDGMVMDFNALNVLLNQTGFTTQRSIHVRQGDLDIAANNSIIAARIDLVTDNGAINIGNNTVLDASGNQAGYINIAASNDINIGTGARLDASAETATQRGGRIFIGTTNGALDISAASTFDVSGKDANGIDVTGNINDPAAGMIAMEQFGGRITLRAPRIDTNTDGIDDDVALSEIGAAFIGEKRIDVEAFSVGQGIDSLNTLLSQATTYINANAGSIIGRLNGDANIDGLHFLLGIEIISATNSNDIEVELNKPLDFSDTADRFNSEPGVLTIRAAGDLAINENINDGFITTTSGSIFNPSAITELANDESWSYRLVAGADLMSADPLQTLSLTSATLAADKGDFTLAAGKYIRTGTGDIDIAAARDVILTDDKSVIYTAGNAFSDTDAIPMQLLSTQSGFFGSVTLNFLKFPKNGGNISIDAGSDITILTPTRQLVNEWLWRTGGETVAGETQATAWTVKHDLFGQGVGALAGGNININAANNINDLSAAVATIGRQVGGTALADNDIRVEGGGNLTVHSGNDLRGGRYYVDRGEARLVADGDIGKGGNIDLFFPDSPPDVYDFAPILAIGQGDVFLQARRGVETSGILHPSLLLRSKEQIRLSPTTRRVATSSYFIRYTEDSRVGINSIAGNIDINADGDLDAGIQFLSDFEISGEPTSRGLKEDIGLFLLPPTLIVNAYQGSIFADTDLTLYPASKGTLEFLANNAVTINGNIILSDVDPARLPGIENPIVDLSPGSGFSVAEVLSRNPVNAPSVNLDKHAVIPVHADRNQDDGIADQTSLLISANTGDITFGKDIIIESAKQFMLTAGRDIINPNIEAQNLRDTDVSVLRAGRDILYTLQRDEDGDVIPNTIQVVLDGPGRLDVIAGRDLDLGSSNGIITRGNSVNPFLPEQGADVVVLTGANDRPDFIPLLDLVISQNLLAEQENAAAEIALMNSALAADERERQQFAINQRKKDISDINLIYLQQLTQLADLLAANLLSLSNNTGVSLATVDANFFSSVLSDASQSQYLNSAFNNLTAQQLQFLYTRRSSDVTFNAQVVNIGRNADGGFDTATITLFDSSEIDNAVSLIKSLPASQQQPVAYSAFYAELRQSGRTAINSGSLDFSRGFNAVATLFAENSINQGGDALLFFSQIQTLDGGDISFLVPGGFVNAGLSTPPEAFASLDKNNTDDEINNDLGIVVRRTGNFSSFSSGDFLVNESRVFAGDGGNILLWSNLANIDAGRGSKTALSAPPPRFVVDETTGFTIIEFQPALTGSGIRGFVTTPGNTAGDVDLFAPNGIVNAADAGIGSAGNIFIGATEVLGADNIDVGGSAAGFTVPDTNVSISLNTTGDISAGATSDATSKIGSNSADRDSIFRDNSLALLFVELLGFGDEECDPGTDPKCPH